MFGLVGGKLMRKVGLVGGELGVPARCCLIARGCMNVICFDFVCVVLEYNMSVENFQVTVIISVLSVTHNVTNNSVIRLKAENSPLAIP